MEVFGHTWSTRVGRGGAGNNHWSDGAETVSIDVDGRLVLGVRKQAGIWRCAEVFTALPDGPVQIDIRVGSALSALPAGVIVGLFAYRNDRRELDFEYGAWGDADPRTGQFVVQPHTAHGNRKRFVVPNEPISTHTLRWRNGWASFASSFGNTHRRWTRTGSAVPARDGYRLHLNVWLRDPDSFRGSLPSLVIEDVQITRL
ncbi:MAG: hypothetical protein ACI9MR_003898 [Myxococcota bacterium]